jgi:hypothetical protein
MADLRRGMALKAQAGVGNAHTFSVVYDLNKRFPGILHHEFYLGSAGIDSILKQFFDDGSRPLHHLTGSYLVGNVVRK